MDTAAKPQSANPLDGLYVFARAHLLIINTVVAASTTLVAVLDFLAPRLSVLPKVVYSATAFLALLMLVSAFAPALLIRLISAVGLASSRPVSGPLWRRPAWQIALVILLAVSTVGFASVSKADQGGLIASNVPGARTLQESMLGLKRDVAEIRLGVNAANSKLDILVATIDPANAADRCADIGCAVGEGASAKTVRKLFERGAKLPTDLPNRGVLAALVVASERADRLDVLDALIASGLNVDMLFDYSVPQPAGVTPQAAKLSQDALNIANYVGNRLRKFTRVIPPTGDVGLDAWTELASCLTTSSGGVALIELAMMRGDDALYEHLVKKGVKAPGRPLVCKWSAAGTSGGASRIEFLNGQAVARKS